MKPHRTACAVAAALVCAVTLTTPAPGAFTFAQIDFWTGATAGEGIQQAAVVIDFAYAGAPSGAPSLAWGYRWAASDARTGQDLLAAVVAADPRLSISGLEFGFVDTIAYDANLDGVPDFVHPGFDPGSGSYSAYWVNNAVIAGTPPLFTDAGHVLPPNGNPYAQQSPGTWVSSSTGMATRPLADGSWDGWVYAADPAGSPREPVAAVVPEPVALALLAASSVLWIGRRRRTPTSNPPAHNPTGTNPVNCGS